MKFIKEKLTKDYLIRRIREEDAKSDRKVTEVHLTPAEWHEFRCAFNVSDFVPALMEEFHIAICEPVSPLDGYCGPRRVTIKRGAP